MGLYLYCLLPAGGASPGDLRGVDGSPVAALDEGAFRLWVSQVEAAPRPSPDRVRSHHAVVRAAMDGGTTPLPMRFGQWFPGREVLARRLEERGRDYGARLRDLEDAVELGVRFLDPAGVPVVHGTEAGARTGREYLEALAGQHQRRTEDEERGRRLARELGEALGDLVRRERIEPLEPGEGLVSVAHLVGRSDMDAHRRGIDAFRRAHGGLQLRESGPWPPYSFVD